METEIERINVNKSLRVMDIVLSGRGRDDSELALLIAESFKQKFKLSDALVHYMEKELTPEAPLVLDDAFVRFDDTRLSRTLDILKNLSLTRQVILFSCQSREKNLLNR